MRGEFSSDVMLIVLLDFSFQANTWVFIVVIDMDWPFLLPLLSFFRHMIDIGSLSVRLVPVVLMLGKHGFYCFTLRLLLSSFRKIWILNFFNSL